MARLDSLSIELITEGKDKCAEEYGKVVENLKGITLASRLKNTDLSGDPTSGTVEAKRFTNVKGKPYGTARAAGKGQNIKAKPVVIAIDDDQEYIEEVESKDIKTYGVNGLIERRSKNHQDAEAVDEDTKFFAEAVSAGNSFTATEGASIEDEVEEAIEKITTLKNDFVNGVPRNFVDVVLSEKYYGKLRNKINAIPNSNGLGQLQQFEEGIFNNTKVYSSVFLPNGINYIVMVRGAVAQPVMANVYSPDKIQLSEAIGFGLFTHKGTKAVSEDLIFYNGTVETDEGEDENDGE